MSAVAAHATALWRRVDPRQRQQFIIFPSSNVLFVRVPKAGSSSVRSWFLAAGDTADGRYNEVVPRRLLRSMEVISFVRNPYSRLASAWADRVRNRGLSLGGLGDGRPDFATFVERVEQADPLRVNPHVRLQSILLRSVELDFLGRNENLDEDLHRLGLHLGIDPPSVAPRNVTGAGSSLSDLYDVELLARVRRLYRADFDAFDYDPEILPS